MTSRMLPFEVRRKGNRFRVTGVRKAGSLSGGNHLYDIAVIGEFPRLDLGIDQILLVPDLECAVLRLDHLNLNVGK